MYILLYLDMSTLIVPQNNKKFKKILFWFLFFFFHLHKAVLKVDERVRAPLFHHARQFGRAWCVAAAVLLLFPLLTPAATALTIQGRRQDVGEGGDGGVDVGGDNFRRLRPPLAAGV